MSFDDWCEAAQRVLAGRRHLMLMKEKSQGPLAPDLFQLAGFQGQVPHR